MLEAEAQAEENQATDEVLEVAGNDTDEGLEPEIVVSIGDDDEDSPSSEEDKPNPWAKVRELAKEKKALEKRLQEFAEPEPDTSKLPVKPSLESCEYDEEAYEQQLSDYYETKRKYDEHQSTVAAEQQEQAKAWSSKLDDYNTQKSDLKMSDEVEQVVRDELSELQQGIIVSHAKNAGLMVMALGKNPKKARELADIKDPIKFALAMNELEQATKVTKRMPPKPETHLDVSRGGGGGSDKQLAKLREEASSTGDFSKVTAYRRNN